MQNVQTYANPWHDPERPEYGPETYVTAEPSSPYRGFDIYNRLPQVFDVVKDGRCVGQFAGANGARQNIDAYLDDIGMHYLCMDEAPKDVPGLR